MDRDEPLFVRRRTEPRQYVLNGRNPVGLVLIVAILAAAGMVLLAMALHKGPFA